MNPVQIDEALERVESLNEQHFTLSNAQRDAILSLAKKYEQSDAPYKGSQQLARELKPLFSALLSSEVVTALSAIKEGVGSELISIGNLPVDFMLPDDECLEARVAKKTRVSEICLLGVNSLLEGQFQEETSSHQKGFIHQVTPLKQWAVEASGRGAGDIPFHAENMFIKRPPSVLSLFCLQGEKGVETEYLYVSDILKYLGPASLEQLKKPLYRIVTGDGFQQKELSGSPVLDELGNGWQVCRFYEEDRIFSDDKTGQQAVEDLHQAILYAKQHHTHSVELNSGTLLLFSNAIRKNAYGGVLHGRRGSMSLGVANTNQSTSKNRWLQRVCIELNYNN